MTLPRRRDYCAVDPLDIAGLALWRRVGFVEQSNDISCWPNVAEHAKEGGERGFVKAEGLSDVGV